MIRLWMIVSVLAITLAVPAAAQPKSVSNALERLHTLCDQNYKPACIRLGIYIAKLPPAACSILASRSPGLVVVGTLVNCQPPRSATWNLAGFDAAV